LVGCCEVWWIYAMVRVVMSMGPIVHPVTTT
jgi:hypothetical protein